MTDFFKKHTLVTGTLLLTATGFATRVLGFFYRIFLSRTIGAEGLGLYNMVHPVYGICFALCAGSIQTAISRFVAANIKKGRDIFRTGLTISLAIAVPLALLIARFSAPLAHYILLEDRCAALLPVMALSVPFSAVHACVNGYYYGLQKTRVPAFAQIAEQLIRMGAVFLIADIILGQGGMITVQLAVAGHLIGEIASCLFTIFCFIFFAPNRMGATESGSFHASVPRRQDSPAEPDHAAAQDAVMPRRDSAADPRHVPAQDVASQRQDSAADLRCAPVRNIASQRQDPAADPRRVPAQDAAPQRRDSATDLRHVPAQYASSQRQNPSPAPSFPLVFRQIAPALMALALPLMGNRLVINLLSSAEAIWIPNRLIASGLTPAESFRVYGVLTGMAMPFILFPSAITNSMAVILLPAVAEAQAEGQDGRIARTITMTLRYSLYMGILCIGVFTMFGDALGRSVFHDASAGTFMEILAWLCPFLYLSTTTGSILNGLGRTRTTFLQNVAVLLLRIGFVLFGIPRYGITAYLWGMLAAELLLSLLHLWSLKRLTPFTWNAWTMILHPTVMLILSIGILYFARTILGAVSFPFHLSGFAGTAVQVIFLSFCYGGQLLLAHVCKTSESPSAG